MAISTNSQPGAWTFLTSHGHVLLCLAWQADMRMRDIARNVGITERAAQRIVADLRAAGYVRCTREGRRNVYSLERSKTLRHPLERGCSIGELLDLLLTDMEELS